MSTRFVVLSSPRSGTHMLRTSLDGHPEIVCLTEMLNPDYSDGVYPFTVDTSTEEILGAYVFRRWAPGIRAVGFCVHRLGARTGNRPEPWDLLAADRELHVISLRRRDLLRRHLSFRLRGYEGLDPPPPLDLDPGELRADFDRQRQAVAALDELFADHPLRTVVYEDLVARYQDTMDELQRFLGVRSLPLAPGTLPRPRWPLTDVVRNHRELAEAFAGTEWAQFFD